MGIAIGLALPQYDYSMPDGRPIDWPTTLAWARRAEALGFDSVWVADHLFLSIEKYGAPSRDYFGFDPIVALGGLARATRSVRVGSLVLCAPLRPERVLAAQLRTIERLAPRRLVAGLGAGWYEPEFAAAGIPFERPGARLRQLGRTADTVRAAIGERVPVWIGGRGDRLLQLVAGHADGWNTTSSERGSWCWTVDDYGDRLAVFDQACARAGRDPAEIERSVGLSTLVGADEQDLRDRFERLKAASPPGVLAGVSLEEWRVGRLVGTRDEVRAQRMQWEALGVRLLICNLGAVPFSVHDAEALEVVASALI